MNHFTTFDLPVTYSIYVVRLAVAYRDLQAAVHPDRFVNATDAEKRIAMTRTVEINDAYTTLKDPVQRAMYLLSL